MTHPRLQPQEIDLIKSVALDCTPSQRKILNYIADSKHPLSAEALTDHLYCLDPNGGPDNAIAVARVFVYAARKALSETPFTIKWGHSGYSIQRREPVDIDWSWWKAVKDGSARAAA